MKNPINRVDLGTKEYLLGNFDSALKLYKSAIPDLSFSQLGILYYNMGLCYYSKRYYKNAERLFHKSFYDYDYKISGYELSLSKLSNGDLEGGFSLYKFRYYGERNSFPNLPLTRVFNIGDCFNKKVLVLNEQGFGDELLFSRTIEKLSELCISSSYQVYPETIELFNSHFLSDGITFFDHRVLSLDFIEVFDCWISTGDLFTSYTLEYGMSYKRIGSFSSEFSKLDKIGLNWTTNGRSKNVLERSIDLEIIDDVLFDIESNFYNLNRDCNPEWMINYKIDNFSDLYDLVSGLDLVITVDTVTAHLSGIMNKPTILIYDKYLDWRWNYKLYDNIIIVNISNLGDFIKKIFNI